MLLIGAGLFSCVFLSRWASDDPVLVKLAAAAYLVRVSLAVGFFSISAWQLPVFRQLQLGDGLWRFAGDTAGYHEFALRTLNAWKTGLDLHAVFGEGVTGLYKLAFGPDLPGGYHEVSLLVAGLYKALGASPLHFMLVNAWLGSLTVILSYLIARRLVDRRAARVAAAGFIQGLHSSHSWLADRRAARIAAALVAFWPSSVLWSTQILKDTVVSVLISLSLFLVLALWRDPSGIVGRGRHTAELLLWPALAIVVMVLALFRWYTGLILLASVGVAMGIAAGVALVGRRWQPALNALGLIIVIGGAILVARSVNPLRLFSPAHPEVGYVNQGIECQQKGEVDRAVAAYRQAIEVNPRYAPAYRNLGLTLTEQGQIEEGAKALRSYLTLETNPEERKPFEKFLAQAGTSKEASTAVASFQLGLGEAPEPITAAKKAAGFISGLGRVVNNVSAQIQGIARADPIQSLNSYRSGSIFREAKEGEFGVDSDAAFANAWDILTYLPQALAVGLLTPFPWQWFDTGGVTGIFRSFSAIEVTLIYLLLPGIMVSCWLLLQRHREEGWLFFIFIALMASLLALTVVNLGTLFRLRLQFLLPLLIAVGVGGLPVSYRRLLGFL